MPTGRSIISKRQLTLLLLLAASLRIVAALTPGFHHPDAIYQYLEPAHRLLTGDGLTTWEWRVGMRSWLLPALLAGPMAIGGWLGGDLDLILPRVAAALASLGIVWAAWSIGRRASPSHALLAGFVAATWFEFVHFGAQTLAEPIATAAYLPAAAILADDRASSRAIVLAGALLAVAILLRPHYAPACLALVVVARWRDLPRAIGPLLAGGIAIAAASAAIDLANHAPPFSWMVENIRQNIVEHRADRYGIAPRFAFVAWYLTLWRWWCIPILIGLRFGWRRAPALVIAALVDLALHSLIGHKEYRFVFLTSASLVIVAAIGWAEILRLVAARWSPHRARLATIAVFVAWGAASVALASDATMAGLRREGRAGSILFADIRHDPKACGVAIVEDATFADVPGPRIAAPRHRADDLRGARSGLRLRRHARPHSRTGRRPPTRVVTTERMAADLPAGYARGRCERWEDTRLCLFARPTTCIAAPVSPFAADRALPRSASRTTRQYRRVHSNVPHLDGRGRRFRLTPAHDPRRPPPEPARHRRGAAR